MSLQDRLDDFKRRFESGAPPFNAGEHIVDLQHRATAELIASGLAETALKVGDRAPSFQLQSVSGDEVRSDALLAEGPLVVSFYRGVWCPYCNLDLQALEEAAAAMAAAGATLVAISPQTVSNSRKASRENGITFDILADPGNAVARRFGLVFRLPDYLRDGVYKPLGADLERFNGDDSWELPMPARYVVRPDGVIAYAEVSPDYTIRPDPEEVIAALEALRSSHLEAPR